MENKMKLEKFNLEEALNGAKVVTRIGLEVSQLTKFEGSKEYQLAGVMDGELKTWTEQGGYYTTDRVSNSDLFLAVEPQRKWVNVYYLNGKLFIGADQYNYLTDAYLHAVDTPNMQYIKTIEITDEPNGK
jgi:hypothetical protein